MNTNLSEQALTQQENSGYNLSFLLGVSFLLSGKYKQARLLFLDAITESRQSKNNYFIYHSYLDLASVLMDYKNGIIHHSHSSSNNTLPMEPDIQINKACAEFLKGNRGSAFQALRKIDNLHLSPRSSEEVYHFLSIADKREKNSYGELKRNNFVNKSMGKLLRKKEEDNSEHIEAFILQTAKLRYKDALQSQLH